MLSPETQAFYRNWRAKADELTRQDSLSCLFDSFFSHFVVFNRLYAEATFELARRNQVTIRQNSFPDSKAAKEYSLQFMTATSYVRSLDEDNECSASLASIKHLISTNSFAIKLDLVHGSPQREVDRQLLAKLESTNPTEKGKAVLDLLYSLRCNMFHGHKGFEPVQREILSPSIALLKKTSEILFEKLNER